jgi:hypothetical protein
VVLSADNHNNHLNLQDHIDQVTPKLCAASYVGTFLAQFTVQNKTVTIMAGGKHKNAHTQLQILLLPCEYVFSPINFLVNLKKPSCTQY